MPIWEDQKKCPDAATPVTIPASGSIDLAALFAAIPGANQAPYARAIENPSGTLTLTVTVSRLYDSLIASPGTTGGTTMSLQPGETKYGLFTHLYSSASSGSVVNVER